MKILTYRPGAMPPPDMFATAWEISMQEALRDVPGFTLVKLRLFGMISQDEFVEFVPPE